jgi:hypothetical protein
MLFDASITDHGSLLETSKISYVEFCATWPAGLMSCFCVAQTCIMDGRGAEKRDADQTSQWEHITSSIKIHRKT